MSAPDLVQLDLFGQIEAAETEAARQLGARAAERAAWLARFERVEFIAAYDWQNGVKAGDVVLGWRCPDPACGEVESTSFTLSLNHGFDPDIPGRQPYGGGCTKLSLLAASGRVRCCEGCGMTTVDGTLLPGLTAPVYQIPALSAVPCDARGFRCACWWERTWEVSPGGSIPYRAGFHISHVQITCTVHGNWPAYFAGHERRLKDAECCAVPLTRAGAGWRCPACGRCPDPDWIMWGSDPSKGYTRAPASASARYSDFYGPPCLDGTPLSRPAAPAPAVHRAPRRDAEDQAVLW